MDGIILIIVPAYERLVTDLKRSNSHEVTILWNIILAAIQVISASA